MGLKLLAIAAAVLFLAGAGGGTHPAATYLQEHQRASGAFAEPGGSESPWLTSWALLGLRAAGVSNERAADYLLGQVAELERPADVELAVVALPRPPPELVAHLQALVQASGRIGTSLNTTVWGMLALRAARQPVPAATIRYLLCHQARSGGWSWIAAGAPDSNDTAAAIEALRAAGVRGRPIARGIAYLSRFQRSDGGFELARGRGSDTQSTAWAVQAFVAAGRRPPARALAYLRRMQRPDGSFRYSARYVTTPVWVTAQALAALALKPFPLL